MCQPNPASMEDRLKHLEDRIKELNEKASQLLLFLSFALVVAAILETQGDKLGHCQTTFLTFGMRCWAVAIFPILIGVLPVKEIRERDEKWYSSVQWFKFAMLGVAIVCIMIGTLFFVCAIWRIGLVSW
jgi:hypothetical protein